MKKFLLLTLTIGLITTAGFSQTDKFWSANNGSPANLKTNKAVGRLSFPKEFKLFNVNATAFKQELFTVAGKNASKHTTVISLPNADGNLEDFEIVEASNFEPELQAKFPEIRAYSGKGITDKYATVKLSYSPQGIQTMIFRTEKDDEFMEPYSNDQKVYAVFKSHRDKGNLPWSCTTEDKQMASNINKQLSPFTTLSTGTSTGQLKTMRLAQSCNGEYANYFGATSSAQVALVLAAYNATLTRCNGVYEKDLALHLNLITNTTAVIYYDPSTDPYTTLGQWNAQLQSTLTSVIGEANYDIGHMFGASGGGGNAGCIGCVCVNGSKGSGITSPADGIPQGDNFDIDYVVHEVGHQLGANHTFSMSLEGTGVNKEIGSGITIMGYAGITAQDVAPHSIDIFHEASIAQIQSNLAGKTCPITTNITANNVAPVIGAVSNYTIPISTPFALTASASDANGDPLTYCWEQNDNSTTSAASSVASATKTTGPNWLSFSPAATPARLFPKLSTILAGALVSGPLPGGDAGANTEALSSVSRTLNFRLTVRDNHPYSSTAPIAVGQTAFTDVVVTVTNTSGPFQVTAPNTNITWSAGSTATVTWAVNGTNAGSVNCQAVNILLSTDGGNTFPAVLASSTANDGTEVVTVPSITGTTNRIKVESVGNIFFDISNTNFTIGAPAPCADPAGLTATAITQTSATLGWNADASANSYDAGYKAASSSTWITAATATTAPSVPLSGLTAGTLYDYRVRINCAAGIGNYVQAQFTTTAPVVTCPGSYDVSTNGTIGGAATIPLNTDVFGLINVKSDNDYYKFTITTGGTITITLGTLPADYQLALLSSTGSTLQSSLNSGTVSETIARTVTAGTYYARVYPRNNGAFNASSCYTLRVQTGTAARMAEPQYVSNTISVSPNPARNTANLTFNAETSGTASISVISQTGAAVSKNNFAVNAGANTRKLDVSSLVNGTYFIKIQKGSAIQMAKLVVGK
ncbi:zinc-dependent metalloprotease family protein [soil metagenome]